MEKNALTEEQKKFLEKNFKALKEKELFEKLAEFGPEVDEKEFMDAIRAISSKAEEEVFRRNVSEEELASTGGGLLGLIGDKYGLPQNCYGTDKRNIYEGGFPNCAATVEKDSWCGSNDACFGYAVQYQGMKKCKRAWK